MSFRRYELYMDKGVTEISNIYKFDVTIVKQNHAHIPGVYCKCGMYMHVTFKLWHGYQCNTLRDIQE